MPFEFTCATCGQIHRGMPSFGADAPLSYYAVPIEERSKRCQLESDECVIDGGHYFVRGCIEIPVLGQQDPFVWGVWVSLSKPSFALWKEYFHKPKRAHIGPFFGWLNASLRPYPDTVNLKTRVHIRDNGTRPFIELEPTNHPMAIEQREGISSERVAQLYAVMVHESAP